MIRFNYNSLKKSALLLLLVSAVSFSTYSIANALAWPVLGTGFNCGYFTQGSAQGSCANSSSGNANVISSGISIGVGVSNSDIQGSVAAANGLVSYLKNLNSTGSVQDKTGAAFIVNTMLGKNSPGSGTTISNSDWTTLTSRLVGLANNGSIQWNAQRDTCDSNSYSSYYSSNRQDDIIYIKNAQYDPGDCDGKTQVHALIDFYDLSGNIVYTLDRTCANPMGKLGILPNPSSWNLTPETSVSTSTAYPGDTVTWTHTVTNTGITPTNKVANFSAARSGGFSGEVCVTSIPLNFAANASTHCLNVDSFKIPTNAAAGTQYCSNTHVSPMSSASSNTATSANSCVTVKTSADPCKPITTTVNPITYVFNRNVSFSGKLVGESSYTHSYYIPTDTPPVQIVSLNQTTGATTNISKNGKTTWTAKDTINITSTHTTGDPYRISFKETRNHLIGFSEYTRTISVYHWVNYSRTTCSGGKKPVCRTSYWKQWELWYTYQAYDHTTANFSDGQQISFQYGSSTPSTNSNGNNPAPTMPVYSTEIGTVYGVGPCYDFTLTSNITRGSSDYYVESGTSVTPFGTVNTTSNTGSFTTHSRLTSIGTMAGSNTQWQVLQLITAPNVSVPTILNANSTSTPCTFYSSRTSASCSILSSGNGAVGPGQWSPTAPSIDNSTLPAGTKVCFALSIKSRSGQLMNTFDDQWNNSTLDPKNSCIIIVKKPKTQILGGDLSSGGLVQTSTTNKGGNRFGSWVEYAIFATGSISGTASGSAYSTFANNLASATVDKYSKLSFTNTCTGGLPGCYISSRSIPSVISSFAGGSSLGSTVVPSSLASGTYNAGNILINASTLPFGKSIIIKSTGTVTIVGDQIYDNSPASVTKYTDISQLPQLVIIANNIIINSSVNRIDAWLVATNNAKNASIQTCESVSYTINECTNKLVVNGPVMTDRLYLYRTAGSGTGAASGDPAEVFNLRADAYLWSAYRSMGVGEAQTVRTTDVPPRN